MEALREAVAAAVGSFQGAVWPHINDATLEPCTGEDGCTVCSSRQDAMICDRLGSRAFDIYDSCAIGSRPITYTGPITNAIQAREWERMWDLRPDTVWAMAEKVAREILLSPKPWRKNNV